MDRKLVEKNPTFQFIFCRISYYIHHIFSRKIIISVDKWKWLPYIIIPNIIEKGFPDKTKVLYNKAKKLRITVVQEFMALINKSVHFDGDRGVQ